VLTDEIHGDWSDPMYLNRSGVDPSLLHDEDGRKWLVNLVYDHRKGKNTFGGILLQEYSPEEKRLVGPIKNIFRGTELGFTEGPHLYKKDGYYYLLTAEGGTWYDHAVTIARSRNIDGPYEVHPDNPLLTSKGDPSLALQRAGHADLVETQDGEWYMVHLCSRPLAGRQRSILGRETAIQKIEWREGWPYLVEGGNKPAVNVPAPALPEQKWEDRPARDDFDGEDLALDFQTLRIPLGEDHLSLKERPGYLRLKGAETLSSKHRQSLVARRQEHHCYTATTCLEFEPESFQQMAGLVAYYNTEIWYYLKVSWNEDKGKSLGILSCNRNDFDEPLAEEISLEGRERIYLRVKVDYENLQFYYSTDGEEWKKVGPVLDASILSDEYATYDKKFGFTGAFVGICCQDLTGRRKAADFDFFEYIGRE
ncbi:MAG: glycoside hydrolase family 43 protein, partial [Halanaerobiales bacterium]